MEGKLAENIRALRKEKRMTQEQLAECLDVTVGAVSKWESGATTPDLSMIMELAHFLRYRWMPCWDISGRTALLNRRWRD